MKCNMCGAQMMRVVRDLPFKASDQTIVVLKRLPVLQCGNCTEYLIEDAVMARIEVILTTVDDSADLEVIRYAA